MGTTRTFVVVFLFSLRFLLVLATLNPKDFLALQSIRKSLHDLPGSTFFASWDFTADPCAAAFAGVLCEGDRVSALALGDPRAGAAGLSGRLHPAVGRLSALSELTLVPGRVFGPLPSSLSLCYNLRFLAVTNNYISGEIPNFSPLRRLRTLDLSFNLLSGRIPGSLASIDTLSTLILSHNRLSGEIPGFPSKSPLQRLDLKRNNLSGEIPSLPPSIRYLSLSSNRLSGRIDRVLVSLSKLNFLDLSFNRLSGPIPGRIFSFPIANLYLQRNRFSGTIRPIGPAAARETLDLSYNRLTGRIPAELAAAERVYLNFNRFGGMIPARFVEGVRRGEIRVLYVQYNYLRGIEGNWEGIPRSASFCVRYNCMDPPPGMTCPVTAGRWRQRPAAECRVWGKG